MKQYCSLGLLFFLISVSASYSQESFKDKGMKEITGEVLKAQLGFLSSDWMEGREAYEKGGFMAADYIASMLRLYGVAPFGDMADKSGQANPEEKRERSYFQNFILIKTQAGEEQVMRLKSTEEKTTKWSNFAYNVDFSVRPSDQTVEFEAPVVFAGYGFIDDSLGYNDFAKLDVKGKVLLKLQGFPKFVQEPGNRERTYMLRNKMEAKYRSMGIAGIIEFDPEQTVVGKPASKEFTNMSPAEGMPWSGKSYARYTLPGKKFSESMVRIQASARAAGEILHGLAFNIDDYRTQADKNHKVIIPELKGKSVYIKSAVITSQVAVRNVTGIIEGKNPHSCLVVGAHYDHLGAGNGYIWNGADDNGSGTVGVMTIAKAVAATGKKPENSIIFSLWTAEEEGLLGSRYWVRNLDFPTSEIKVNMNFDMISRYVADNTPDKVTMTFTSAYPWFRDLTAENVKKYGIALDIDYQASDNPPGGTDHRSFVEAGIPVIRIKPGHREEYHTPKDDVSTLNWDIMEKIVRIGFADIWDLAERGW